MPTIVYPGSFDPITLGHVDLVGRVARLCNRVVVAIGRNPNKQSLFTEDERVTLAREAVAQVSCAEVVAFDGLLVDFVQSVGGNMVLRGLRAVSDFEFEFQLATMSRQIAPEVESVFLTPAAAFSFISSSMVREIGLYGGDISEFVHPSVESAIRGKAIALGR